MIVVCSAEQAHRLSTRTNISRIEQTHMEHDLSSLKHDIKS